MKITRVWACCGVFGWLIPWPEWHTHGVYAQPPGDDEHDYVYLFSKRGQMDSLRADGVDPTMASPGKLSSRIVKIIDLDNFLDRRGVPDWSSVLSWILAPPCLCGDKACKMGTKFMGPCGNCGQPVHASCSMYGGPSISGGVGTGPPPTPEPYYCSSSCYGQAKSEVPA